MSSFDKEVGGRVQSPVWRKRRRAKRSRAAADSDFHPLVRGSIVAARDFLLGQQEVDEGVWCGLVAADAHVTAEYLLLLHWLGRAEESPTLVAALRSFLAAQVKTATVGFRS